MKCRKIKVSTLTGYRIKAFHPPKAILMCLSKNLHLNIANEKTKGVLRKGRGGECITLSQKKDLMRTESQSGFWVLQPNTVKPESLRRIYPHDSVYYISPVKLAKIINFLNFCSGNRMASCAP